MISYETIFSTKESFPGRINTFLGKYYFVNFLKINIVIHFFRIPFS